MVLPIEIFSVLLAKAASFHGSALFLPELPDCTLSQDCRQIIFFKLTRDKMVWVCFHRGEPEIVLHFLLADVWLTGDKEVPASQAEKARYELVGWGRRRCSSGASASPRSVTLLSLYRLMSAMVYEAGSRFASPYVKATF